MGGGPSDIQKKGCSSEDQRFPVLVFCSGYGTAASATYNGSYYETGGFPVTIKGVAHWNVGVYMGMPKEEVS